VPKPLRVSLDLLHSGVFPLPGPVARYVSRVHRLGLGDRLSLFDPSTGLEADAELVEGPAPGVWCRIETPRPSGYRPLPVVLIQGLGKADKPDEVIRAATALGVAGVALVQAERSVPRVAGERAAARLDRWRRIAVEAARQSGRGDIPSLTGPARLSEVLAAVTSPFRLSLTAGGEPLLRRLGAWRGRDGVTLLVGPEGGFDAAELLEAEQAGFLPASLGSTTLRTELAGVAALGALVALGASIEHD
jgi:16S rRNA (uracil1498-N3)-methyltransferase